MRLQRPLINLVSSIYKLIALSVPSAVLSQASGGRDEGVENKKYACIRTLVKICKQIYKEGSGER